MDVICDRLRNAVVELKINIDKLNTSTSSPPSTPSTPNDIRLILNLLIILKTYYETRTLSESSYIPPLYPFIDNIDYGNSYDNDYHSENKNLYKKILSFIWIRKSKFFKFIFYIIPHNGDPTLITDEIKSRLDLFLQTLTDTIEQTTAILASKNAKDGEVPNVADKKFFSFPAPLKKMFGKGRNAVYDALLEKLRDDGEQGSCTPEQYFSMLHTMGLIAIELCKHFKYSNMNFDYLISIIHSLKDQPQQPAQISSSESPSSGGATSRRRRRRRCRNHSSLHSRKSINRNKKSKKIRKLYTSKHRIRTRNKNKPKNKSRK